MRAEREKGMQTGLVVTCYATHATPAAFYAHIDDRRKYQDIALQFIDSDIDVTFAGGKRDFVKRKDERDLIAELRHKNYQVVEDFTQLANIDRGRVVGLFADEHLPSMLKGRGDYLPHATAKALEILQNNAGKKQGFFLMVEGSQIDFESHDHNSAGIYAEMKDFDKAVGVAMDFADQNSGTLVVVCSDHDTGGLSIPSCKADFTLGESGVEYKFSTTGHSAAITPVFAYGACAERFTGLIDNTDLAKIIFELMGF